MYLVLTFSNSILRSPSRSWAAFLYQDCSAMAVFKKKSALKPDMELSLRNGVASGWGWCVFNVIYQMQKSALYMGLWPTCSLSDTHQPLKNSYWSTTLVLSFVAGERTDETSIPCESEPFFPLHHWHWFCSSSVQLWVARDEGAAAEKPCHCPSLSGGRYDTKQVISIYLEGTK